MLMENKYVIDNEPYDLGKDIDGKHHDVREIHPILIDIMLEFDRVCRKNSIPYALAFGSALGIHNYGGFIPWDDDMDIAIDYFDTPRLVEALKKDLGEKFSFDCYEDNKRYNVMIPTFKIRYKESYIKEKFWYTLPNRCHNGDGVFIDIVAFMGVPQDRQEHVKLLKYAKNRMVWYTIVDAFLRIHPYGLKKKLKEFEAKVASEYKDSPNVSQTVIIPFQDWAEKKDHISYPREVIYPFKEYDFAGHKFFSFQNVEEFCRLCYGPKCLRKQIDGVWVDPLPLERRKAKHNAGYSLTRSKK